MGSKTTRSLFVIAGMAAILSGCETLDPYTGESQTSNTTKGALIGAAAGVVAGLMSGDDAVELADFRFELESKPRKVQVDPADNNLAIYHR